MVTALLELGSCSKVMACFASIIPSINLGDSVGEVSQETKLTPALNNKTKTKRTNKIKANLATKLLDSKNSSVPEVPLLVEKEYELLLIYIYIRNKKRN
jgi:hypothetical protein